MPSTGSTKEPPDSLVVGLLSRMFSLSKLLILCFLLILSPLWVGFGFVFTAGMTAMIRKVGKKPGR